MAQFETTLQQFQAQQEKVVKSIEVQSNFNSAADSRMTVLEQKVDSIPNSCEAAINRAIASQEKRLDQKFDQLMAAVSAKRAIPEVASDEDMEASPLKPPLKK